MNGKKIRLLLVEDEHTLAEIIADTLSESGFEVCNVFDGEEALRIVRQKCFDVIVTDIMMPKMDGFTFLKQLRKEKINTPVLFLSARTDPEDVIMGFELGAKDYIRKPFSIKELIVRIRSLAGECSEEKSGGEEIFSIGTLMFDPASHKLSVNGKSNVCREISLPARESELLAMLCKRMGEIVPNTLILETLWGNDDYFCTRSLNVHITRLRKKLSVDPEISIDSYRGTGYRLRVRNSKNV